MNETKILVLIHMISTKIITKELRTVSVEGPDIQDGKFSSSIEVPLSQPYMSIDVRLTSEENVPFVIGNIYTDENGLSYKAINQAVLASVTEKVREFKTPSFVIRSGSVFTENAYGTESN